MEQTSNQTILFIPLSIEVKNEPEGSKTLNNFFYRYVFINVF